MRGTFAAIDVGTNSVRLRIVRVDRAVQTLVQERDPIRPGEGVFTDGAIAEAAVQRLVATLTSYAGRCRELGAEVRAVATSALRDARNQPEVLAAVRRQTGLALEVLSGAEEARLTCLGILADTPPRVCSLCIDIGGGSTEIAATRGERPVELISLPLGALRLTDEAPGPAAERLSHMRLLARSMLRGHRRGLLASFGAHTREGAISTAIAGSGTARAIIRFATGSLDTPLRRDRLTSVIEELELMSAEERSRSFGAHRAQVIVAGAVILEAAMDSLDLDAVRGTKRGLRDGVILSLVRATRATVGGPDGAIAA
jgi:exopolyphosphatase/guanosine-5'-triphosphate,3'-diphosphate pyrophosphatase